MSKREALSADLVYEQLCTLSPHSLSQEQRYLIAYSGGLDSHVLLHLMATIAKNHPNITIHSLYIDHGLQEAAEGWQKHCQYTAKVLAIPHQSVSLDLQVPSGESIEGYARRARYQALKQHLHKNEILLTAHHQNDQAETLLLQLLRGSGLDGLAAMPTQASFGKGTHCRPLLNYCREQLEAYASQYQLVYITDPSNDDTRFDRNYLRKTVIPLLKQRWPQMDQTVSRSASLQAEAASLLNDYCKKAIKTLSGSQKGTLSVSALKKLSITQQKALLRYWIKQSRCKTPSSANLEHILTDVLDCSRDASPLVKWQEVEIRRYKDNLYIVPSHTIPVVPLPEENIPWDLHTKLELKQGMILDSNDLGELKTILLQHNLPVTVRFRQGGERIRPDNKHHSISLKKLFQQMEVPPWLRQSLPLIYANEQLIAVLGLVNINKTDLKL